MTTEQKKYCEFMNNPENEGRCDTCPENKGFEEGNSRIAGPCGQQNCWVRMHCEEKG